MREHIQHIYARLQYVFSAYHQSPQNRPRKSEWHFTLTQSRLPGQAIIVSGFQSLTQPTNAISVRYDNRRTVDVYSESSLSLLVFCTILIHDEWYGSTGISVCCLSTLLTTTTSILYDVYIPSHTKLLLSSSRNIQQQPAIKF